MPEGFSDGTGILLNLQPLQSMKQDIEDQLNREKVPTLEDVPTLYRPTKNYLMIVPLPTIGKVGSIIIPDRVQVALNEGHIVAKGPRCTDEVGIGDCVTWDSSQEFRMEIDGVKFLVLSEGEVCMSIPFQSLIKSATDRLFPPFQP